MRRRLQELDDDGVLGGARLRLGPYLVERFLGCVLASLGRRTLLGKTAAVDAIVKAAKTVAKTTVKHADVKKGWRLWSFSSG